MIKRGRYGKILWSDDMIAFLKDNHPIKSNKELAAELGLSLQFVRNKLYELGLFRMTLEYWTEEQTNFLLDNYRWIGDKELAEIYNRAWPREKAWSFKHIEKKRMYLKLKRTKIELQDIHRRNVDAGRFLMCPVKRWETCGSAAEGEIRYWRESGGRFIPRIKINGKFIHWARWRWEQDHGPIPKGFNIVFKDNNPRNIDPSNLEIIPDAELSRRNAKKSSQCLSDNYIAGLLSHKQKELREALKSHPELLELKRQQLKLQRQINNHETGK